jgi:hypothetical protein
MLTKWRGRNARSRERAKNRERKKEAVIEYWAFIAVLMAALWLWERKARFRR